MPLRIFLTQLTQATQEK